MRVDFGGVRPPVERKGLELATGSGFVVAPSGLVLTSLHVVAEDRGEASARTGPRSSVENRRIEVAIGSGGGQGVFEAHVVASDVGNDLAALQVTAGDLPYLPLGDSDAVEPGRPVQVLGFPVRAPGRGGETGGRGRRSRGHGDPRLLVGRTGQRGGRDPRSCRRTRPINPGNSGGPMLDEDGYVVGVVKMKLARDATSQGAGFSVPVERRQGLPRRERSQRSAAGRAPAGRRAPHARLEGPRDRAARTGTRTSSPSRTRVDAGEVGEIGFRAYRLPTEWPLAALEEALLGGREVPGFVPAPASAGRRQTPGRRLAVALPTGSPPSVIASAEGSDASGRPFRVEYSIVDHGKEKVLARYLGPADAVAFNLGLIRRSLLSLEAARMLFNLSPRPLPAGTPALESVSFPEGEGQVLAPAGLVAGAGLRSRRAAGCPRRRTASLRAIRTDFTLVLRALRWTTGTTGLQEAVRACGQGEGRAAGAPAADPPRYALRFERLGVPIEARGLLVQRGAETLLLELEAPVAKLPIVEALYDRWVREVAAGH